jgi:tetratricopeptide (TPR) repeat protein
MIRVGFRAGWLGVLLAAAIAGCRGGERHDLIAQAHALGAQWRWEEAQPLVKAYLIQHPEDPSGHFLLGRTYLHQQPPYLTMAEGEFETALALFRKRGDCGGLAEALPGAEFESAVHREIARAQLRWAYEAMRVGIPFSRIRPRLEKALDNVQQGRALTPDSEPLAEMEQLLRAYLEHPDSPPSPPPAIRREWSV